MIKNIIFDVGGILLDDSVEHISKVYGKDMSDIYSKIFRGNFRNCLYGTLSMKDYLSEFENDKDYKYISEILDSSKQDIMTPLIEKNFKYICSLNEKGYHLYLLSNLTNETCTYLKSIIDIDKYFDGAVFSCEVGIKKPDREIFELIIDKYNLNLSETVYFDDKERMVSAAKEYGFNAIVFKSIEDIEKEI